MALPRRPGFGSLLKSIVLWAASPSKVHRDGRDHRGVPTPGIVFLQGFSTEKSRSRGSHISQDRGEGSGGAKPGGPGGRGETSTELWKMKAETSPLTEKMMEVEEVMENHKEVQEA